MIGRIGLIELGIGLIVLGIGLIELGIGLIELRIGLIELGIGLIELRIGLIELVIGQIGLIELRIGLIELGIGLIELGIGLRINNARRTVLAHVSGLVLQITRFKFVCTEENHSNEHASYEIPPLTNIFESPIILSLDSLLKKIA